MSDTTRWGIIGTGSIAKKFATGLTALPDAQLYVVGSRFQETADVFADQFDAPVRHSSYESLAQDVNVDAVYVATPHSFHKENSLLCLAAGKPVLCEKPFTINVAEAQEVVDFARQNKVFLMEAMWTRYIPLMVKLRQMLAEGVIGEVRMLNADFGFGSRVNPTSRLYDPHLGGGAMLDVGVYPISLASMIFGTPESMVSLAQLGQTGIDEQSAFLMRYPGGQIAIASTSIQVTTPQEAVLLGTEGNIRIHSPWWVPSRMTLTRKGQDSELIEVPFEGNGYNYEAAEVADCIRNGKTESSTMPLDETLSIMQTMDEARAQWGLKYPME